MATLKGHRAADGEPVVGSIPEDLPERYRDWRDRFITRRLRVLYIVGLVVNPIFMTLEFLAHLEHLGELTLKGFRRPVTTYNVVGLRAT